MAKITTASSASASARMTPASRARANRSLTAATICGQIRTLSSALPWPASASYRPRSAAWRAAVVSKNATSACHGSSIASASSASMTICCVASRQHLGGELVLVAEVAVRGAGAHAGRGRRRRRAWRRGRASANTSRAACTSSARLRAASRRGAITPAGARRGCARSRPPRRHPGAAASRAPLGLGRRVAVAPPEAGHDPAELGRRRASIRTTTSGTVFVGTCGRRRSRGGRGGRAAMSAIHMNSPVARKRSRPPPVTSSPAGGCRRGRARRRPRARSAACRLMSPRSSRRITCTEPRLSSPGSVRTRRRAGSSSTSSCSPALAAASANAQAACSARVFDRR